MFPSSYAANYVPATSTGILFSAFLLLAWAIVYPLYISGLRHVPGPKIGAITSFFLNIRYYNESAVTFIKSLHDKYGPIVRVGPNEVVLDDPNQLPAIYGVRSTFPKPPTAVLFENYGFPNSFSSISREQHKKRRKQVAHVYSMNAQLNNTSLLVYIQDRIGKVLEIVAQNASRSMDIYSLAGYFALDNVSYMVYGESLDTLGGKNRQVASDIRRLAIASAPFIRFHWFFDNLPNIWPFHLLLPGFMARAFSSRVSLATAHQEFISRINSDSTRTGFKNTTLDFMKSQPEFGKSFNENHVKSECFDHILAGADTTAASITYAFYTLALPKNIKYQDRLREEISHLSWPLDFKAICGLPYLEMVVLEVLRLYAPGPGSLQQRVTPPNQVTRLDVQGKVYTLPPGTLIGIQAYSLHRNRSVFGDTVDDFCPERWQTDDAKQLKVMKESWIAFGTGARACIGMNFATIELKAILAAVLRQYIVELDPVMNPDDVSPILAAIIRPKTERCDLKFIKTF